MKGGIALIGLAALAGCNQNMVQQPRDDPYEESPLFPKGMAMQAPPDGTVDRAAPARAAAAQRPPMSWRCCSADGRDMTFIARLATAPTAAARGRDRGAGLSPAAGLVGAADRRGASAHVYDVISNGYGVMYAQGDRVGPADRWAIAAYVRALQAQHGAQADAR